MKYVLVFFILCAVYCVNAQYNPDGAVWSGESGAEETPDDEFYIETPSTRRPTRPPRTTATTRRPSGSTRPIGTTRPSTRPPPRPTTTTPGANPGIDGNGQLIGCPCHSTQETNLVCGTDGNTYGNMNKLKCAQRCGHKVEVLFLGNCRVRS